MTDSDPPRSCCSRCISFIFTSGLTALFLWLSLRVSPPICSIENLDAFALNKTANSTTLIKTNHTITYDLKLNNKNNKDKGIHYDAINVTFYYKKPNNNNNSMLVLFPIGNVTIGGFYQGHQKSTHRYGAIEPGRVFWENATTAVAANGTVVLRVELATKVRYKIVFWNTKRHRLVVGADLQVNDQGTLVRFKKNKGIKLSSGVDKIRGCFGVWSVLLCVLVFVHLW